MATCSADAADMVCRADPSTESLTGRLAGRLTLDIDEAAGVVAMNLPIAADRDPNDRDWILAV